MASTDNWDELPLLLTVEEFARVARLGRTAAYDAVRRGDIPSVRIGRSLRIPREELRRLTERQPA